MIVGVALYAIFGALVMKSLESKAINTPDHTRGIAKRQTMNNENNEGNLWQPSKAQKNP
uniref:Uncharacterized protein n=1 Tax=Acrobeloides nanus TaxID=290746 RepID=A0A914CRY5_9BILA